MARRITQNRKWTIEKAKNHALLYRTRMELYRNDSGAYYFLRDRGLLREACEHMGDPRSAEAMMRCVYVGRDAHRVVYVGITNNPKRRQTEHRRRILVLTKMLPAGVAKRLEQQLVTHFGATGWTLSNKAPCGSLGAINRMWTRAAIAAEASKFKTKVQFRKGSPSAYAIALKDGHINDVCGHMVCGKRALRGTKYTREQVMSEAEKFSTLKDFYTSAERFYRAAKVLEILGEATAHMTRRKYAHITRNVSSRTVSRREEA